MAEKLPWYVQFTNKMTSRPTKKFKFSLSLSIVIIIVVSTCFFYIFLPRPTYEETYDIQFDNYINDNLKEVANIVIEEGEDIKLNKIPDIVLEYDIKYTEQGIKFNYSLNNEKIVYDYYLKTSKMPKESYSEKEMEMTIELSKDFRIISKESSLSDIPTHEEYYRSEQLIRGLISVVFGMCVIFPIFFIWLILCGGTAIATSIWNRKHTN